MQYWRILGILDTILGVVNFPWAILLSIKVLGEASDLFLICKTAQTFPESPQVKDNVPLESVIYLIPDTADCHNMLLADAAVFKAISIWILVQISKRNFVVTWMSVRCGRSMVWDVLLFRQWYIPITTMANDDEAYLHARITHLNFTGSPLMLLLHSAGVMCHQSKATPRYWLVTMWFVITFDTFRGSCGVIGGTTKRITKSKSC